MFTLSVFTISFNHFLVILLRLSFSHMPSMQCAQTSNRFTICLYSPTISYYLEAEHLDLKSYYILKSNLDSSFAAAARTEQNMYVFHPSVILRPAIYLRNLFRRQVVNDVQPVGSHGPNVPHTWYWVAGCWSAALALGRT